MLRARWEYGHVAHAVLLALGFAALVTSVLVDTVPWRASGRRRQGRREARRLAALDEGDDGGETGLHEA